MRDGKWSWPLQGGFVRGARGGDEFRAPCASALPPEQVCRAAGVFGEPTALWLTGNDGGHRTYAPRSSSCSAKRLGAVLRQARIKAWRTEGTVADSRRT